MQELIATATTSTAIAPAHHTPGVLQWASCAHSPSLVSSFALRLGGSPGMGASIPISTMSLSRSTCDYRNSSHGGDLLSLSFLFSYSRSKPRRRCSSLLQPRRPRDRRTALAGSVLAEAVVVNLQRKEGTSQLTSYVGIWCNLVVYLKSADRGLLFLHFFTFGLATW